jgi:hypothetical protein
MPNLERRLAALETASLPPGAYVVVNVTYDDAGTERTPDAAAAALAAAHVEAGARGTVIIVEHVDMTNLSEGDA